MSKSPVSNRMPHTALSSMIRVYGLAERLSEQVLGFGLTVWLKH